MGSVVLGNMCDQCQLARTSAQGVLDPFRVGASPYVLMSVKKTRVYTDEFKTIAVFTDECQNGGRVRWRWWREMRTGDLAGKLLQKEP